MSKDSGHERDNEIIVSFAKKPKKATVKNGTEERENNTSSTTNQRETGRGSLTVPPGALGIADEVLGLVSSERVEAEPQTSSGEEQIPSSAAPKSVMVLVEGMKHAELPDATHFIFNF